MLPMFPRKLAYIYNDNIRQRCDKLPTMKWRATIIQDLMIAYSLTKNNKLQIIDPPEATFDELLQFHSKSYIDFIKSTASIQKENEAAAETFGLLYDCPLLENTYQFVTAVAGGSIKAAQLLNSMDFKYVVNWFGGWHHAQSSKANGFCYVNDIVLAIKQLNFPKILYLDLDVHHGDGVEDAFKDNENVLTLSIHKCSPGFYPGTGLASDVSKSKAIVNVALLDGISDSTYDFIFKKVFKQVYDSFQPDAMIVQCGADILAGDPLGECNVTIQQMGNCIKEVIACDKPTLFLGGGGYSNSITARYWCYLTAVILGVELDEDIPVDAQFFQLYTPTFELSIDAIMGRKDYNTKVYLDKMIKELSNKLDFCQ